MGSGLAEALRRGLAPPRAADPSQRRQGALLHSVVVFIGAVSVGLLLATPLQSEPTLIGVTVVYAPLLALHAAMLALLRRGHVQLAARLYVTSIFAVVTAVGWLFGGMTAPNAGAYVVLTVLAGFVLGGRAGHAVAGASVLAAGLTVVAETAGHLPAPLVRLTAVDGLLGLTANLLMAAFLVQLGLGRFRHATWRAERGEHALRASVQALRTTQARHEARARQGVALARLAQEVLQLREVDVARRRAVTLLAETLDAGHVALLERDLVGRTSPRCQRTEGSAWPDPVPPAALEPFADVLRGESGSALHGEGEERPALQPNGRALGPAIVSAIPGRERVHGVLVVSELAGGRPHAEDVAFVETVAGLLGGVTEHERSEERLRHAQKMEVVGQLAGGVAHDFNNLLTSILSSVCLAAESLPPDRPEHPLLEEVRDAGELAALLTRQLLAFSRSQVLRPERLCVDEVVGRMERLLRRLVGDTLTIRAELGAGGAATLCDRGNLEQVVLNLAVNARDAAREHGTLVIATRTLELAEPPRSLLLPAGRYVVLSVRDDGHGMSQEVARHVFEPFFTTKEASQGTGLGLFTVHGIATAAGGDVRVTSAPGEGTCFEVFLPVAAPAPAAAAQPAGPAPTPAARSGPVLLVEDDSRVRRTARRILGAAGYELVEASHGEEALAHFDGGLEPALVVTDRVMPRLGGVELAEALIGRGYRGPILLMSGYAPDAAELARLPADRVAVLSKPFVPGALTDKARELLAAEGARTKRLARRGARGGPAG